MLKNVLFLIPFLLCLPGCFEVETEVVSKEDHVWIEHLDAGQYWTVQSDNHFIQKSEKGPILQLAYEKSEYVLLGNVRVHIRALNIGKTKYIVQLHEDERLAIYVLDVVDTNLLSFAPCITDLEPYLLDYGVKAFFNRDYRLAGDKQSIIKAVTEWQKHEAGELINSYYVHESYLLDHNATHYEVPEGLFDKYPTWR